MVDEQDEPPAPPKPPPRRRPTPTIDLKATEVASETKEQPAMAGGDSARKNRTGTSSSGASEGKPPPFGGDTPGRPGHWQLAGAGIAGGLVVALVFAVLWQAGIFSQKGSSSAALSERLSAAEARLAEIAGRPAPAGPDNKAGNELAARLAKLEQAVAAAPTQPSVSDPAAASRLALIDAAIKSLQDSVNDLARRADDTAAATREARGRADASLLAADAARSAVERNNVESLGNRIATLEGATDALISELAKRTSAAGELPLRVAIAAQALRAAVERGDLFAAELAAVKALKVDTQKLAPLEPFASSGLPPALALAQQLSDLIPAMQRLADVPAPSSSFLERLQANAERLVRVRPVDEAPGSEPAAVIGRIEAKAARADIAGALADLAQLPASVRAPAEDWIKKAQARNAAVAASRQFAGDTLAALSGPPP